MTPLVLEIILAIHCCADPEHKIGAAWNSDIGIEIRNHLVAENIIEVNEGWQLTDKGLAYLNYILSVRFPNKQVWSWG